MANITLPARAFNALLSYAPLPVVGLGVVRLWNAASLLTAQVGNSNGRWRISGTLTVSGTPAARKVLLFAYPEFTLRATTWSDPVSGAYTFDFLPATPQSGGSVWGVLGVDHTGAFDPECKIGLIAELMP